MKVEELRIGNIVKCEEIKQFRVDEILWIEHLGYTLRMRVGVNRESTFDMPLRDAEPIPITDEMLLKCGFNKLDYTYNNETHYNFGDFGLVYNGKAYYYGFVRYRSSDDGTTEIPRIVIQISSNETLFVHQLQNLYFALTGEELKIDL